MAAMERRPKGLSKGISKGIVVKISEKIMLACPRSATGALTALVEMRSRERREQ